MSDVTLAEIARSLNRIETEVHDLNKKVDEEIRGLRHRMNNLDTRITGNTFRIDAINEKFEDGDRAAGERIAKVEDNQTWFARALILEFLGILVMAALIALQQ